MCQKRAEYMFKSAHFIWYSVTTIWVFEYYSEITYGPNTEYE